MLLKSVLRCTGKKAIRNLQSALEAGMEQDLPSEVLNLLRAKRITETSKSDGIPDAILY